MTAQFCRLAASPAAHRGNGLYERLPRRDRAVTGNDGRDPHYTRSGFRHRLRILRGAAAVPRDDVYARKRVADMDDAQVAKDNERVAVGVRGAEVAEIAIAPSRTRRFID